MAANAIASPQWREKPVQCGTISEILEYYVDAHNLKPLFVGVSTVKGNQGHVPIPIIFYLQPETGQWLYVEYGFDNQEEACVIGLGDGWDANVEEYNIPESGVKKSDKT